MSFVMHMRHWAILAATVVTSVALFKDIVLTDVVTFYAAIGAIIAGDKAISEHKKRSSNVVDV